MTTQTCVAYNKRKYFTQGLCYANNKHKACVLFDLYKHSRFCMRFQPGIDSFHRRRCCQNAFGRRKMTYLWFSVNLICGWSGVLVLSKS
jgi:hypothetical protein